jgi:hypothetical protein
MVEYIDHFGPVIVFPGRVPEELSQSKPIVEIIL